jgi:hypothetical protein
MIGDLGERIEPVDGREDFAAVRRIVLLSSITRTFSPVSFGLPLVIMLSMKLPLRD